MNFVDILALGTLTRRVPPTLVLGSVTYESMIMLKSMHRWHLAPKQRPYYVLCSSSVEYRP